jgi:formate-dependent nitrite reductase membrane component NrfD
MSRLFVAVIFLFLGLIFLFVRLFLLIDVENLSKEEKKKREINGWALILSTVLFFIPSLLEGWIFISSHETYSLVDDSIYFAKILCFFLLFMGIDLLYYKENIFEDWRKRSLKVPKDFKRYRNLIIIIGIIFVIIGIALIIWYYAIPFLSKYYLLDNN